MGLNMDFSWFIGSFIVLMVILCGFIIFAMRWVFISSTNGAIKRLNADIAKVNEKQGELNKRLKEADEELARRQQEAKELAETMRTNAEEESKAEREKIISKAREEGEEIIAKAQQAKDKVRQELEKTLDLRVIDCSLQILSSILSEKARAALDEDCVREFLEGLKATDMTRISQSIKSVEVITVSAFDETIKKKLAAIIKEKLGRELTLSCSIDASLGGGIILKFGSMALDGSLKNRLRERALAMKEEVETRIY